MMENTKICQQIDYYFSDFNLNNNRYLRNLLIKSTSISVDELLKFNMLRLMANNMTKEELIAIVTDYEFEFAHYFSSNQSFGRNPKNPFIYDKHYLLKHNDLIVHLSKLPPGTTIADVIDWSVQYGAYGVNVIKRQAEDKNLLRSALIVFKEKQTVDKLLEQRENDKIPFQLSSNNDPEAGHTVTIKSYRQYFSYRNKLHKKKKKEKLLTLLSNLSINDNNEQSSSRPNLIKEKTIKTKNVFGIGCLVAKRTIFLAKIDRNKMLNESILKQGLKDYGLLYIYTINKSNDQEALKDYYFYFKNRSLMFNFYINALKKSSIDFCLRSGNNNDDINFHLPIKGNLTLFQCYPDTPPLHFNNYVKCIRSFYKKKPNPSNPKPK